MKKHFIVTITMCGCVYSHAAVFTYSFDGSIGNEATFPVDAQPAHATAGDISRGTGVGASSGAGTFSANN